MMRFTFDQIRQPLPGLLVSLTIALAAAFLSEHYGGPVMLFALLLGMAFNFLSEDGRCVKGIDVAAKRVLRLGVALLGARISFQQMADLGWFPLLLVMGSISATLLAGLALARLLGLTKGFGVLTGGAVAICGASAAMALSAALPRREGLERDTIFTVIGVTTLSTLAMILYPLVVGFFHLGQEDTGLFLGATIHDVAQVVGAGYMVSEETGDIATLTKLLRVAMLIPLILGLVVTARSGRSQDRRETKLPWFLLGFVIISLLCNTSLFSPNAVTLLVETSRWALITAIAALGMKTSLGNLAAIGHRAVALIVGETVFLAVLVLAAIKVMQ